MAYVKNQWIVFGKFLYGTEEMLFWLTLGIFYFELYSKFFYH